MTIKMRSCLIIYLTLLSSITWGGERVGNGGDDIGLNFFKLFSTALSNIKNELPDVYSNIYSANLKDVSQKIKVVVVDEILDVRYKDIIQNSVATNIPSEKTIYVNRKRWNAIFDENLKEAIALHEVLSLYGIEQSGFYPISSKYLDIKNISKSNFKSNIYIDRFKQLKVENPNLNSFEILKLFFYEAKSAPEFSDFEGMENYYFISTKCQVSRNDKPASLDYNMLRIASITMIPEVADRGPLFPGTPAIVENRILFGAYAQSALLDDEQLSRIYSQYEVIDWSRSMLKYSPLELIETAYGYYPNVGQATIDTLAIRKNNGLVSFKFEQTFVSSSKDKKDITYVYYGYCYKQ